MRANLQREVVAATLGGGKGTEPVQALFRKGLDNFRQVRLALREAGLQDAVRSLRDSKAGRDYVRVALRRGVTARFHLAPRTTDRLGSTRNTWLVSIHPVRGAVQDHMDAGPAAAVLAERVGTDVEAALRVVLGIERARKRCYELCEEGTRWL